MAKQGPMNITLVRDGHDQPWGFRLQGGIDHSQPLQVQRVFIGSPSEGNLHRGDTLLRIGNQDATKLTHQEAHDIITHTGNTMSLTVQRSGMPMSNAHFSLPELSVLISDAAHKCGPQPLSPTPTGLPYHQVLQKPVDLLPVSKIPQPQRQIPEGLKNHPEYNANEVTAIHSQPYRTTPLITPGVKVNRDIPTGTYMRFHPDPKVRENQPEQTIKQKGGIQFTSTGWNPSQQVYGAVTSAASQQQHKPLAETAEGKEVYNLQYNSPMNLYSQENISATMKEQTGLTPVTSRIMTRDTLPKPKPAAKQAAAAKLKSEIPGPKLYAPGLSPTYNAVADEEWGNISQKTFDEKRPIAPKIKTVPSAYGQNAMGMPTEKIAQSHSFMRVMQEVGF